jgi:hypothetical protein
MSDSATVLAEELASTALRDWLLLSMPAAVERVNTERNAVLSAGKPGPYTIPPTAADAQFNMGTHKGQAAPGATVVAGDYTAAELVTAFNNGTPYPDLLAEVDAIGRFSVRTNAGTVNNPATLYLGPELTAGFNAALGWPAEKFITKYAIETPALEGVFDGWPVLAELTRPCVLIIGDREYVPLEPQRRDEYDVTLDLTIMVAAQQGENHKSREAITGAVRAVRTALFDTAGGRQLGLDSGDNMVVRVRQRRGFISGKPFSFNKSFNPLYDVAVLTLVVTTYCRQGA